MDRKREVKELKEVKEEEEEKYKLLTN